MLSLHPRQTLETGEGRVHFELTQVFLKEEVSILRNVLMLSLFNFFFTESKMKRSYQDSKYEGRSKLTKNEQKLSGLICLCFLFTCLVYTCDSSIQSYHPTLRKDSKCADFLKCQNLFLFSKQRPLKWWTEQKSCSQGARRVYFQNSMYPFHFCNLQKNLFEVFFSCPYLESR